MGIELFRKEANFIKDLITNPCARPWFVYVETFLPAFLKLMITVVLFDVEDAIRAHGESIVRDRKGKKGKRHSPRIKAQGSPRKIDRYAMKGLKVLLVVTEPLEKIGFTWLVFSAVDQFFYDWQSLLETSGYCLTSDQLGPLTRGRGPGLVSFLEAGVPVILNNMLQNRASWPTTSLGAALPGGRFVAVFGLTVIAPQSGIPFVWIRLRTDSAFGPSITRSDVLTLAPFEQADLVVRHEFFHHLVSGGSIVWEVGGSTIPIGIETVKGHMSVFKRQL